MVSIMSGANQIPYSMYLKVISLPVFLLDTLDSHWRISPFFMIPFYVVSPSNPISTPASNLLNIQAIRTIYYINLG